MTREDTLLKLCFYMLDFGQFEPFNFYEVTDALEHLGIDWQTDVRHENKHVHCCDCKYLSRTSLSSLNRPDHLTCFRFVDGGLGGLMEVCEEGFCYWGEPKEEHHEQV